VARRAPVRYLIVGGGIAGTLAAQEIRKRDPEGSLRIVGEEPCRLYNRTLLSKDVLLGADPARIFLKDASFYERRRIELSAGKRVLAVDARQREASLSDGSCQPFERLLIATGAEPVRPALEGIDAEGVCVLRSLADALAIRERAASTPRAVCAGGGFIGIETACALSQLGLEVDLVMLEPRVWLALLPERVAGIIEARLAEGGVRLHPGRALAGFQLEGGVLSEVRLVGGRALPARLAVLGLGVRAALGFLSGSAIPTGRGVLVGATLETSVPGVYAAGDVAEVESEPGGPRRLIGHWSNAVTQGRVAGANLAGRMPALPHEAVPLYDTCVFDLAIAFVGEPRAELACVIHGSLEERRFIAFFLEGERLRGAVHVNRADAIPASQALVSSGRPADARALAGEGAPDPVSVASAEPVCT
jgi:NADPH-dependent 2,4-dienoyl-CoA reductase/sulfur reductase-like enzyme